MALKKEFDLHSNNYYRKSLLDIKGLECSKEFWNVDETIAELSYLTHDYFRYYGKFPSKVGKLIIEDLLRNNWIDKTEDFLVDNYAGSGTSLVEAKLAGIDSVGIDINPFAVLACRVKTYNYNVENLHSIWGDLREKIYKYMYLYEDNLLSRIVTQYDKGKKEEIDREIKHLLSLDDFTKWFSDRAVRELVIIKKMLLEYNYNREREFFDLGFFAVIRRVSHAYDAEVRPHVNKKKKERSAIEAFTKKIDEMLNTMSEWNKTTGNGCYSNAYLVNNVDFDGVNQVISNMKKRTGKKLGAIISHPPYLNCFDYIPVYKLKFMWAEGFNEIFGKMSYEQIKASEIKSYPVNNDCQIDRYFEHNYKVYKNTYENLRKDGFCCVIIGDCTVKKELFSVHKAFIKMLEETGFKLIKIAYRSTNYGMGKYAYNFRACYSEDQNSKQDAILFFKK